MIFNRNKKKENNMNTSAAFSTASTEDVPAPDRLWQFLQSELRKPIVGQKNEIVSSAAFFCRPLDRVEPRDFIYAGVGGLRKSTVAAFIKTPEAVFVMCRLSGEDVRAPAISLREMRSESDILSEIERVPTVLRRQIINDFSPQMALDVMDEARRRHLLPAITAHNEVVVDFGGKTGRAIESLRAAVCGARPLSQMDGPAAVMLQV